MTVEELKQAINQVKSQGYSDEEILGGFYRMYQNNEISLDELDGIVNLMGYHLTDEFLKMSNEEKKTQGVRRINKENK